jgi:hypothetical protein
MTQGTPAYAQIEFLERKNRELEDVIEEALPLIQKLERKNEKIEEALTHAFVTLNLIAVPKRNDGTYNRCREACEVLARETLDKIMEMHIHD